MPLASVPISPAWAGSSLTIVIIRGITEITSGTATITTLASGLKVAHATLTLGTIGKGGIEIVAMDDATNEPVGYKDAFYNNNDILVPSEGVWEATTIDSLTPKVLMAYMASVLCGKVSGSQDNAPVFRSVDDLEDRVTATTDDNGNRTAITLNPISV